MRLPRRQKRLIHLLNSAAAPASISKRRNINYETRDRWSKILGCGVHNVQPVLSNVQQVDHGHSVSLTILRVHSTATRQCWASHVHATRTPRVVVLCSTTRKNTRFGHIEICAHVHMYAHNVIVSVTCIQVKVHDVRRFFFQFLIDFSKCYDVITRHRHNIAIFSVPVTWCANNANNEDDSPG